MPLLQTDTLQLEAERLQVRMLLGAGERAHVAWQDCCHKDFVHNSSSNAVVLQELQQDKEELLLRVQNLKKVCGSKA